jgi:hypothetical protein
MIMTKEELADIVAIFNAEDMARGIRKETIEINGATVICWETGLIERTSAVTALGS